MSQTHNFNIQEENDLQKHLEQVKRHYYLFVIGLAIALIFAFFKNQFSAPVYKVTSSVLIKENKETKNMGDYINSSLFGTNANLQNELQMLKSTPVIKQTIKNLDLPVSYFSKKRFQLTEVYKDSPFKILYRRNHYQPIAALFEITFYSENKFEIKTEEGTIHPYNYEKDSNKSAIENWKFAYKGEIGKLIEAENLSFIISIDSSKLNLLKTSKTWYFRFAAIPELVEGLKSSLKFDIPDPDATVIEIAYNTKTVEKGIDVLNELMNVYTNQNLEKKNFLAKITLDYIDKQLDEISDSLNRTERTLQSFRSSKQILNISEQASEITTQYRLLENQKAELISKIRYYEYVSAYMNKSDDYSKMMVPAALGIQDNLLNNLLGELITAQAQKSNLVDNNQEKSPLVKKISIQIENLKKTVFENISYVLKTSEISLDELNKRLSKIESEISSMPNTERQLTGIERKFKLNDAIYNYLMQKRAEAKITKASNLPDNEIIEPAKLVGLGPISPDSKMNYLVAIFLGLIIPFGYLQIRSAFNNRISSQEQIEKITDTPVLGKILHNTNKTNNVVFDLPNSSIAEAYRTLRTNLEYYVRGGHKKVIMVTSCIEGEGKSFNALNIAMSYAQLNRKTVLVDMDLRKHNNYFNNKGNDLVGISSFLINRAVLEDIIIHSPHEKLDYIPSGPIPPNPVELIGLDKTEKLINQLKEMYDYIIIDTPPLAQVTDAYMLIEQADVKILVTRYNYTLKNVFSFIIKDLKQKGIKNTCIVYNDNRYYKDQMGYGYGYNSKK